MKNTVFFLLLLFVSSSCVNDLSDESDIENQTLANFSAGYIDSSSNSSSILRMEEINLQDNQDLALSKQTIDRNSKSATSLRTNWGAANNTVFWTAGDAIGIFMRNTGGTLLSTNVRYNISTGGVVTSPLTPNATPIYFPILSAQNVNFYAYYPYGASLNTTTFNYTLSATQNTQAQVANADYMYATPVTSNSHLRNVNLTFNHVMTMITIRVKTTSASASLTDVRLQGTFVRNRGSLDILTGTLTPTTQAFTPISNATQAISPTVSSNTDFIINPCTFSGLGNIAGTFFRVRFTVNGTNRTTNLGLTATTVTLLGGTRYIYNITINTI